MKLDGRRCGCELVPNEMRRRGRGWDRPVCVDGDDGGEVPNGGQNGEKGRKEGDGGWREGEVGRG